MPISNISSYAGPYFPDGTVTDFPFEFDVFASDGAAGLTVARFAIDGTMTIVDPGLYTVTPGEHGGSANFLVAPDAGDPLFILSDPSFKQEISFGNQTPYLPAVVTEALDRAATRDLYMRGLLKRTMLAPPGEELGLLPSAAVRAGTIQGWDATGLQPINDVSHSALLAAYQATLTASAQAVEAAAQAMAIIVGDESIETVTAGFTLANLDRHKHIRANFSAPGLIALDATPPIGSWAYIEAMGPSAVYVVGAVGVTVHSYNGQNKLAGQYAKAKILKVGPAEWLLSDGPLDGVYTPAPPALGNPPVFDNFDGSSGTITGRTTTMGGKTWANLHYTGANADPIMTNGSGKISGGQGAASNGGFDLIQTEVSNKQWITRTSLNAVYTGGSSISSGLLAINHLSITSGGGTSSLSGFALLRTGATGVTGSTSLRAFLNGTVNAGGGTAAGGAFSTTDTGMDWDATCLEFDMSGSDRIVHLVVNGRRLGAEVNASQLSLAAPFTFAHGYRGSIPAASGEEVSFGNPDSDLMVRLFAPNRIMQRETDGSVNLRLSGQLTVQDPGSLDVRVDDTTPTQMFDWTAVTAFATVDLQFTGMGPLIAAPPSSGFAYRVRRNDIVGGGHAISHPSPITKAGEVVLWAGQSLVVNGYLATSGGSLTAPADFWAIHGLIGQNSATNTWPNPEDRRQFKVGDNRPLATFGRAVQDMTSAVPMCNVLTGRGATDASQRAPGTANHTAQLDGVKHAGNAIGSAIYGGGQYDLLASALIDNYIPNVRAEMNDIKLVTGRQFKTLLLPLTSVWGTPNADSERLNKAIFQATIDYPDEFFLGPYMFDIQHLAADVYHFVNGPNASGGPLGGYDEEYRRIAYIWNLMSGQSVLDLRGPKLFSVTKDSSSQCTVLIDLVGFDDLDLLNYSYAADQRGGLRIAADSAFTTPLIPATHSFGSVAAGKQSLTFTFSGTPFASSGVFVSGPYGTEPFNPDWNTTIRGDMANKASMLVGRKSGQPSIPIRPYYQSVGGDYVSG